MKSTLRPHPLRAVVSSAYKPATGQIMETLECGHVVAKKSDMFGETNAVRRRCRHCTASFVGPMPPLKVKPDRLMVQPSDLK